MNFNELMQAIHKNAKEKGFWDQPIHFGTSLMLIVSELGEALDADRENRYSTLDLHINHDVNFKTLFEKLVKDTVEDELADVVIRVMDLCSAMSIDLEKHIKLKMRYNKLRPKMHEKKY